MLALCMFLQIFIYIQHFLCKCNNVPSSIYGHDCPQRSSHGMLDDEHQSHVVIYLALQSVGLDQSSMKDASLLLLQPCSV